MSNREQVVLNGRYELQRRVGRGGMAEVYLARDRLLDRPVAIKILFPEFATDPSFVARFRREAQSAANLNHPNIVGVYDWGKERGTYYIVMEYIDGRSVSELLRADGPLEPKRAAGIAADVAAALGFAHRKGVVHRDVKPGNVLITSGGEVKVADFGIARAMTSSSEENLTQTGSVMGTATYFSPEQAQGKPVDPRSDLYSLGVVLYEMVSGKPPFTADSPVAIAYKHVQEPVPPLGEKVPGLPAAYEAITVKALAKDVESRYQDAGEVRADLLRFREDRPVQAAVPAAVRPARPAPASAPPAAGPVPVAAAPVTAPAYGDDDAPRRRTGWFFAAILVLLVILGALLFAFGRQLGIFDDQAIKVTVTDVVGQPRADAVNELEDLGLQVDVTEAPSPPEQTGLVTAQDEPAESEVDRDSTVVLTVGTGPDALTLPSVVNLPFDVAREQLVAAGFDGARVLPVLVLSDAPQGQVIGQDPPPGEVPFDTDVQLQVAYQEEATTTTTEAPATTTSEPAPTTSEAPATTTSEPAPTTSEPPATTTTEPPATTTSVAPGL